MASEGPRLLCWVVRIQEPAPHKSCPTHSCSSTRDHLSGPLGRKHPQDTRYEGRAAASYREPGRGWGTAAPQRWLLRVPLVTVSQSHHTGPRSARKVFGAGRACKLWVVNYRVGEHRKPQENSRQGQEQTQGKRGCEWPPGWEGTQRQPKLRWMVWKEDEEMMEQMSRIPEWSGWQQKRELCDQMFALPPGMESSQHGKLSRTSEVRICEWLLLPKARWRHPPDPLCPTGSTAGIRGQATSAPALCSPLGERPLLGWMVCGNETFDPQVYGPGSGRRTHGKGTTSNRRLGNVSLGLWRGLMLACFLLVHNRMAQVKANKTEANAKGLLVPLNENPEIKARSTGGAPGVG